MGTPESWKISEDRGLASLEGGRNAVYYVLLPQKQSGAQSVLFSNPVILPYLDQASISYNHTWSEADNVGKSVANSISQRSKIAAGALWAAEKVSNAAGVGLHASTSAVYSDSAPVTFNVRSKLFSADGDGNLLRFLNKIRGAGFGAFEGTQINSVFGISTAQAARLGVLYHPGWWDIKVVSVVNGRTTTLLDIKDVVIITTNFTFYAPFVTGPSGISEPMLVDIDIGFKQTFRGFRETNSIGPL